MKADEQVAQCFEFCSSKGLDLFGIINGESECRCGATRVNPVWGKYWLHATQRGLMRDFAMGTSTGGHDCTGIHVYRYIGWMSDPASLKKPPPEDATYLQSIVKGVHEAP